MSKQSRNAHQGKRPNEHLLKKRVNSPSKQSFVDHLQNTRDSKNKIQGKTGVIYEESMVQHKCLWDSTYPECPERFIKVLDKCKEYSLLERCVDISPREATPDELLKLHSPDRLELLQGTNGSPDAEALEALSSGYDAIYIHPSTYKLALLAAGSTVELVDSILDGKVQNGMAIIRPPGHHAMKSEYCGYCFYNNVAVAAQHALDNKGISKILIVDWDVHHGQATQQMFYNDPRVLYFSIHRYEQGSFWPNLRESDYHNIGDGPGYGFNVNIPLNEIKMGNSDYMAIFHQVLLPMAYEFQPELIIVSAGYDAALGCIEGEMEVTPACYAHLTSSLMGLASGKVAVVLEGGYCLKSLAEGAALTLRALLGDPCPSIGKLSIPRKSIQESILSAIYVLRSFWKCFQLQGRFEVTSDKSLQENQFWPKIVFHGNDIKATSYPTRNCYPVQNLETIQHFDLRLDELIRDTSLHVPTHRVCLVYDERMTQHRNIQEPGHPERPARITSIYELLKEYGLVDRCHSLQAREATRKELSMLHDSKYIDLMASTPKMKPSTLIDLQKQYGSVFFCPESYGSAVLSAGSAIEVVDSIVRGESRSGIGVIRPPGHHAECNEAYGFCVFNNTALAAKHAIEVHHLERILIVDWDVHHGNGIQRMFEGDPRVLYVSLHRLDIFPMRVEEADCNVVGIDKGAGYTVNIAWPKRGMGDAEYLAAFHQVILPIAYQYDPQLVLVAAGFDAAQGDPLGGCKITPEGYGQITHLLTSLAGGKVAILLEGGYNLTSISHSMVMCCKALLGDPLPTPMIDAIHPGAVETIKRVICAQQPYWSFPFLVDLPDQNVLCPPWVTDPKVFQFNKNLAKNADLLMTELVPEEQSLVEPEPKEKVKEPVDAVSAIADQIDRLTLAPAEAVGTTEVLEAAALEITAEEPKTLQEFLLLPENLQAMNEGTLFTVVPLPWCRHLESVRQDSDLQWGVQSPCRTCEDRSENWICLSCDEVFCGRFVNGHMVKHNEGTGHPLVLSIQDLSTWCYSCESYIDNEVLYKAKNKLHLEKFGEALPKMQ